MAREYVISILTGVSGSKILDVEVDGASTAVFDYTGKLMLYKSLQKAMSVILQHEDEDPTGSMPFQTGPQR
jgi:hypothetical protein